jgi:hypothetical protein
VNTAYLLITLLFAAMVAFSGLGKIRRDSPILHVIYEVIGVPLKYFSVLAACELAGALGLVLGIWWPSIGVAASIGLVLYFVGATVSHLRVGDVKGMGPAVFMLAVAAGALAMRILTHIPTQITIPVPAESSLIPILHSRSCVCLSCRYATRPVKSFTGRT